jgi:hypothetical protein
LRAAGPSHMREAGCKNLMIREIGTLFLPVGLR